MTDGSIYVKCPHCGSMPFDAMKINGKDIYRCKHCCLLVMDGKPLREEDIGEERISRSPRAPDLDIQMKYTEGYKKMLEDIAKKHEDGKVGIKYDAGKTRYSLLRKTLARELAQIARILTIGAVKYDDDNWIHVGKEDEKRTRYLDAFDRHMEAHLLGKEYNDKETGEPHLAHAITNLLFALFIFNDDVEEKNNGGDK